MISVRSVQSFWPFFVSLPFDETIKGEVLKYIVVEKSTKSRTLTGESSVLRKYLINDLVRFLSTFYGLLSKYLYETYYYRDDNGEKYEEK